MKIRTVLAAAALLVGAAGHSQAATTVVSPALPTGTNTSGACYLRNIGTRNMTVNMTALNNFSPGFIDPIFNSCSGLLKPGWTCELLVNDLPDDVTFACSATIVGNASNIRGGIEVRKLTPSGPVTILGGEIR
jgi:hypothetical protein